MQRRKKLSILTDNLKENGIDGLIYLSYGSDLVASYKFWSFSVIKEALYDQWLESCRIVKIVISNVLRVYPKRSSVNMLTMRKT
jgi:hypothetical protein